MDLTLSALKERFDTSGGREAYDAICDELSCYDKLCVFGMGSYAQEFLPYIKERLGEKLICVSDNDPRKHNRVYEGLRCVPPDELAAQKDDISIFVSNFLARNAISDGLTQKGFKLASTSFNMGFGFQYAQANEELGGNFARLEKVFSILEDDISKEVFLRRIKFLLFPQDYSSADEPFYGLYSEDQYFPKNIIRLKSDEVFLDCGACRGDSIDAFINNAYQGFSHIHSFEFEKDNFIQLGAYVKNLSCADRISIHNCGVWNEETTLPIQGIGPEAHIAKQGDESKQYASLIALDSFAPLANEKITYIKMDVEGCELKALEGVNEIIRRQTPKLAICIYHCPRDLFEIPLYIHELYPGYKLYIRQHMQSFPCYETVLYAIPPEEKGAAQ